MNRHFRSLASFSLALAVGLPAMADIVVMESGERREGRVEEIVGEPENVRLISGLQQITLPRARIAEIIEQSDAQDFTILGNQAMRVANYERAVGMFQRAIEFDADFEEAREGLQQARERINQMQMEADRDQQARNADNLGRVREMIRSGNFEDAEQRLEEVASTTNSEDQKATVQLLRRDLYLEWAKSREDRLDMQGAQQHLQKVLEIDPENSEARSLLLRVWERDPSRRDQLLKLYEQQLAQNPDDLVLNQKYADILMTQNRYTEAIEPLKKLVQSGRYRAVGYDDRLKQAYEAAASEQAQQGNFERAIAVYEEMISQFPQEDRKPLAYLRYEQRLAQIEATDWEARAALLDDLMAQGLREVAMREAELILRNDPENEKAMALMRKEAQEDFAAIEEAMNNQQFALTMGLADQFKREHHRFPEMLQASMDIWDRANLMLERQRKQLREQVAEVVAQGDNYLSQARRYVELYKSAEDPNRSSVISYRLEALKFAERAEEAYEIALQRDPSVGQLLGGMDVNTKIRDSKQLQAQLTRRPVRILYPQGRD